MPQSRARLRAGRYCAAAFGMGYIFVAGWLGLFGGGGIGHVEGEPVILRDGPALVFLRGKQPG